MISLIKNEIETDWTPFLRLLARVFIIPFYILFGIVYVSSIMLPLILCTLVFIAGYTPIKLIADLTKFLENFQDEYFDFCELKIW